MQESGQICILCFKPLQVCDTRVGADELYKKLIKCCKKLLHDDHKNELIKWKFFKGCPMPFCAVCFTSADNLYQIEKQLEELYCYLEECISTFTTEIANSRNVYLPSKQSTSKVNSNNCNRENRDRDPQQPPMCPANGVKASSGQSTDEELSLSEDSDDNFEDVGSQDCPDSGEEFEGIDFHTNSSSRENSPLPTPKTQTTTSILKPNVNNVCAKELRVTLERIQLNTKQPTTTTKKKRRTANQSVIIDSFALYSNDLPALPPLPLGRRKAAIQAIESFRKQSDDIDYDDDEDPNSRKSKRRRNDPDEEILGDFFNDDDGSSESEGDRSDSRRNSKSTKKRIRHQECYDVDTVDGRNVPREAYLKVGFKCSMCEVKVNSSKDLESHSESSGHVNERIIVCPDCPKLFYRIRDLREHTRTHRLTLRSCDTCGMLFTNIIRFHAHISQHKTQRFLNYVYQCSVCKVKWASMPALFNHMASKHPDVNSIQCDLCNRCYYTESTFNEHKLVHEWKEGNDPIDETNQYTEWTYGTIEEINEKIDPPISLKKMYTGFRCEVCDRYFESSVGLQRHSEQDQHMNNKNIECVFCHVMFYRDRDITSHRQNNKCISKFRYKKAQPPQNNRKPIYVSGTPGRRGRPPKLKDILLKTEGGTEGNEEEGNEPEFGDSLSGTGRRRIRLVRLVMKKKPKREKLKCAICDCTFNFSRQMDKHKIETGHDTKRQFGCQDCPRMFYRASDLSDHKKNHGDHPRPCEVCGKMYGTRRALRRHAMDKHEGREKLIIVNTIRCSVCKIKWHTLKHLEDHMNTEHEDVNPLKCEKCERQYYNQDKFDEHVNLHLDCISKDIPFEMPNEEKEWTWQNSEKYNEEKPPKPIEKVTGGFPCSVCGKFFDSGKLLTAHSQQTGHENVKTLKCYSCDRPFYRKFDLVRHNSKCTEKEVEQPQTLSADADTSQ